MERDHSATPVVVHDFPHPNSHPIVRLGKRLYPLQTRRLPGGNGGAGMFYAEVFW